MGLNGNATGKGGDLIIVDDPIKNPEEANSKTFRDKAWENFNLVAYTRQSKNAAIIIIMTRWHYDDLVGRILKKNPGKWKLVNLPAFAEENDLLGRNIGEPLWVDRFGEDKLIDIKEQLGSYGFNSLYQQRPVANENQVIKADWIKFHNSLPAHYFSAQSWDTAFEEKKENDFSVGLTGYLCNDGVYIEDVYRKKMEFPELLKTTIDYYNKFKTRLVFVENKGSGISLMQSLKYSTIMPVKAVDPTSSKLLRLHEVAPFFEAGKISFNKNIPHLNDLLEELYEFPYGIHDDFVDALTQLISGLRKYMKTSKNSGVFVPPTSIRRNSVFETN